MENQLKQTLKTLLTLPRFFLIWSNIDEWNSIPWFEPEIWHYNNLLCSDLVRLCSVGPIERDVMARRRSMTSFGLYLIPLLMYSVYALYLLNCSLLYN